jgi:hypothetical protein
MIVADLPRAELTARLAGPGLPIRTGPFTQRIRTSIVQVAKDLATLYAEHPVDAGEFADFHVEVMPPAGPRRWLRPQVVFASDGFRPFKPLPLSQATPILEWGLNWAVSSMANRFLIVHAAAIERNGRAVILPAPPGSGKSTLTAGLVQRGWRLLSDELTLLSLQDGTVHPLARPVNLKNQSIGVIRRFARDGVFSREAADTAKGVVALMKPPVESVRRADEPACPAWIVFPRYLAGAPAAFDPLRKAKTLVEIGAQAFNYSIHGRRGFTALADLVERCHCFAFSYGDLDDAVAGFADLARGA